MSDERLKPCPFCGGEATFIGNTRTIKCKCCGGAFVCTNPLITALEVAAAWNTRKPMEQIVERLEERASAHERIMLGCANVEERHLHCRISDEYKQAIEIVKGGGVDE